MTEDRGGAGEEITHQRFLKGVLLIKLVEVDQQVRRQELVDVGCRGELDLVGIIRP